MLNFLLLPCLTLLNQLNIGMRYLLALLPHQSSTLSFLKNFLHYPLPQGPRLLTTLGIGLLCFPYTRPYNDNKLQTQALSCVFLGYASTQKGYRCLHLPSNKFYISRNVQFVESKFPFHEQTDAHHLQDLQPTSSVNTHLQLFQFTQPSLEQPIISQQPTSQHPSFRPQHSPSRTTPQQPTPRPAQQPTSQHSPHSPTYQPISTNFSTKQFISPTETPYFKQLPVTNASTAASTSTHPMVTRTRDNTHRARLFLDHVALLTTLDTDQPPLLKTMLIRNGVKQWKPSSMFYLKQHMDSCGTFS